jgi:hypothetical protein
LYSNQWNFSNAYGELAEGERTATDGIPANFSPSWLEEAKITIKKIPV